MGLLLERPVTWGRIRPEHDSKATSAETRFIPPHFPAPPPEGCFRPPHRLSAPVPPAARAPAPASPRRRPPLATSPQRKSAPRPPAPPTPAAALATTPRSTASPAPPRGRVTATPPPHSPHAAIGP